MGEDPLSDALCSIRRAVRLSSTESRCEKSSRIHTSRQSSRASPASALLNRLTFKPFRSSENVKTRSRPPPPRQSPQSFFRLLGKIHGFADRNLISVVKSRV